MNLVIGDSITLTEEVTTENTAAVWGSGSLPVYATPAMALLAEKTAVALLEGKLDEGQTSVGTKLNIKHLTATAVGATVSCTCTLIEIDRKRLSFTIEVKDKTGRCGQCSHERFIVDAEKFVAKTNARFE